MSDLAINIPPSDIQRLTQGISSFIMPIRLVQGPTKEVGQVFKTLIGDDKELGAGDWWLPMKQPPIILGRVVEATIIGYRPHALRIKDLKKEIESFNTQDPIFRDIEQSPRDPEGSIVNYAGLEWLFWLPEVGDYATLFCGQPSNRPLSGDLLIYCTPPDKRVGKASKDFPHTNQVMLSAQMRSFGPKRQAWVPTAKPIEGKADRMPDTSVAELKLRAFLQPLHDGPSVEVAEGYDEVER